MTTRKLPFGFHTGIGGFANGLGVYAQTLNQNGIPFTVMAADGMPFEFQEIAKANPTIQNFVGFRRSVSVNNQAPPSGDVNVPDYNKSPAAAAAEHTNWLLDRLPPELDKTITWFTDINEPRHSEVDHPGITEWLAQYSIAAANICWSRGVKYVALNFAGGNHPLWQDVGPKLKELYALAANNPNRLMIGTHEYSWTPANIMEGNGYLVGRIRLQLLDYMPNVPVVVTEFGWSETSVPDINKAMSDYLLVANTYYNHPGIKGAATWYLGGGFGGIANAVQPFIVPLTNLTLITNIELPPDTGCDCPPISDVRTTALWIPQYNTLTQSELNQVRSWARNGFLDNNGTMTTGNHMLCPSHIDALRIHTQGLQNSILGIAYPHKIGTGVTLQWIQQNCPCALENGKQVVFLGQTPTVTTEQIHVEVVSDLGTLTVELKHGDNSPLVVGNCPAIGDVRTTALWIPQYGSLTAAELQQVYTWAQNGFLDNNGTMTAGNHMLCPSHIDALRIHTQGLQNSILGIAYPHKIGTGVTLQWIQQNCPCALENGKQVVFLGGSSPSFEFTSPPLVTR